MKNIHEPSKKYSNLPFGNKSNPISYQFVGQDRVITTEIWSDSLPQPMSFGEDGIYKLVMQWQEGLNYAATRVVNGNEETVSLYVDICSSIIRNGDIFEFVDWYLDVEKLPTNPPVLLDEDEFEAAILLGYLSEKEIKTAQHTAKFIMNRLKNSFTEFF